MEKWVPWKRVSSQKSPCREKENGTIIHWGLALGTRGHSWRGGGRDHACSWRDSPQRLATCHTTRGWRHRCAHVTGEGRGPQNCSCGARLEKVSRGFVQTLWLSPTWQQAFWCQHLSGSQSFLGYAFPVKGGNSQWDAAQERRLVAQSTVLH